MLTEVGEVAFSVVVFQKCLGGGGQVSVYVYDRLFFILRCAVFALQKGRMPES